MIYHILRGSVLHTIPITKGIIQTAAKFSNKTANQHFLCIAMFGKKILYENMEENPYIGICLENSFTNYRFFLNKWSFLWFILTRSVSDKFIIHGNMEVKFHILTNLLFLLFRRDLLKRMSLICWGNNDFVRGSKLKTRLLLGMIREWSYNRFQNILTLSRDDCQLVQSLYPKAHVLYLPYWTLNKHVLDTEVKSHDDYRKVKVLVSHSGWPENNHLKSFELLKKFIPNISVTCPLCYGDANYIEKVISKGKELFGTDFHFFKDLMPLEQYKQLLKSIDVYVTAAERQTGLAAIFGVMDSGAKIYLTGNLLNSFQQDGYTVFPVETIEETELSEFKLPLDKSIAQKNLDIYNRTHYDGKDFVEGWRMVYEN